MYLYQKGLKQRIVLVLFEMENKTLPGDNPPSGISRAVTSQKILAYSEAK